MMKKLVRDGKNVGVVISPTHGAGWYSWHGNQEMLFDPVLVALVERGDFAAVEEYCEDKYDVCPQDDLTVVWIPKDEEFIIHEYDGAESVWMKDSVNWIKA